MKPMLSSLLFPLFRRFPNATRSNTRRRLNVEILEDRISPSTFVVTNNNDTGAGSLDRDHRANAHVRAEIINFNIGGGGQQTIIPLTVLPAITDAVVIDGTTQPGFGGQPLIELNGLGAPSDRQWPDAERRRPAPFATW